MLNKALIDTYILLLFQLALDLLSVFVLDARFDDQNNEMDY